MTAKHLTKNAMMHKLVFLAVGIAIAIIAAFSICATSQAKADEPVKNDEIINSKFLSSADSSKFFVNYDGYYNELEFTDKKTIGEIGESFSELGPLPEIHNALVDQYFEDGKNKIEVVFNESGPYELFTIGAYVPGEQNLDGHYLNGEQVPVYPPDYDNLEIDKSYTFCYGDVSLGTNISGRVLDEQTNMPVPFANVAYCQYNPWGDMYLPVEGVEPVQTNMGGFYTLEGITEEMLPGKVFVYDGIKKIGESEPIWFFPEDMETLYMWPIVVNQEQPDPPVPPTPPDPPVPPGPNPPEPVPPVPPVPPTPVPTPDNPGGGIAQTSDNTVSALVIFAMVALLGAGVLTGRKLYNR